jgi:hypothetical protein
MNVHSTTAIGFDQKSRATFARVDKELELLVGEKERSIGALRHDASEHKCQMAHSGVSTSG